MIPNIMSTTGKKKEKNSSNALDVVINFYFECVS